MGIAEAFERANRAFDNTKRETAMEYPEEVERRTQNAFKRQYDELSDFVGRQGVSESARTAKMTQNTFSRQGDGFGGTGIASGPNDPTLTLMRRRNLIDDMEKYLSAIKRGQPNDSVYPAKHLLEAATEFHALEEAANRVAFPERWQKAQPISGLGDSRPVFEPLTVKVTDPQGQTTTSSIDITSAEILRLKDDQTNEFETTECDMWETMLGHIESPMKNGSRKDYRKAAKSLKGHVKQYLAFLKTLDTIDKQFAKRK